MYETLHHALGDDGILLVTLNRPDALNAFTVQMCDELIRTFEAASLDDAVRAVIVTGAGKAFCAGMDLSGEGNPFGLDETQSLTLVELEARMTDPEIVTGVRDSGGRVTLAIDACRKPVIAAINGAAVGIGATMTLAMDFRLAADTARIGFVFGRIGITTEACSSYFLPQLVGQQQALEWLYVAEPFPVAEGLAAGLIRSIHPADALIEAARDLARRITQGRSATAVAVTRALVRRNAARDSLHAHKTESLAVHWLSRFDGAEGVAAFRERRPAVFTGRASDGLPPDMASWWPETLANSASLL
jgi:enoyl-CoA hydratase/carnithine racemase